jgi:dihydroxyacid dehydratase/phosphogluconate dehydratase
LQSGKPIIGIAQTGSDLSPCNKIHVFLMDRQGGSATRGGGVPMEFPVHPIQETGKRPTAALDRNLAIPVLVEVLHGYPLDGVVLTTGCDKTTPAMLMGAATVNMPAIALNGRADAERLVQGRARRLRHDRLGRARAAVGARSTMRSSWNSRLLGAVARPLQHDGHGLDDERAGRGAGHDSCRARRRSRRRSANAGRWPTNGQAHRRHGAGGPEALRHHDPRGVRERHRRQLGHRRLDQRAAHLQAIARHLGVELRRDDWQTVGHDDPLLVNLQPAGEYLGESFFRAGGVPAVMGELLAAGQLDGSVMTATGQPMAEAIAVRAAWTAR